MGVLVVVVMVLVVLVLLLLLAVSKTVGRLKDLVESFPENLFTV